MLKEKDRLIADKEHELASIMDEYYSSNLGAFKIDLQRVMGRKKEECSDQRDELLKELASQSVKMRTLGE